jgi:hypothetical protein
VRLAANLASQCGNKVCCDTLRISSGISLFL